MEQNDWNNNPQDTKGWEIVKALNEKQNEKSPVESLAMRKLLAGYFKLGTRKPSRLHSAILSCAVKMAMAFPDFHFVPFLEMWGVENLRPEDSDARVDENGKRFPSLVERMTKAYAYSLLFHGDERMSAEFEAMVRPLIQKKGFVMNDGNELLVVHSAVATRTFQSEVRNRKMTFVQLLTTDGEELIAEVHAVTGFSKMRYSEIEGRVFDMLLRTSDNGKVRVEAMCLSKKDASEVFETAIGYIEHVDINHCHIHVFDNKSRHLVSKYYTPTTTIKVGQYVEFIPVIPKEGNFKTAIILKVLEEGPEAFGYRKVKVTFCNDEKGYATWELLPESDGEVRPIIESGAKSPQEPATQGYIHKTLTDAQGKYLPKKGDQLEIITFLKRGKDGKKRPQVVDFR